MALNSGENYIQIGDSRLWSVSTGSGTPVLVFNGGPGCDDYLKPVTEMIEENCQVIRFEPRGCGRSSRDKNYDLQTSLNDADAVRKAYGLDQVILLGHSHGTCVALAYAIQFPEQVTGIIGITGGKVVDDRSWSETYHEYRASVGEDLGGLIFTADPEVNAQGNQTWRAYCRRPGIFQDLARLQAKTIFINASNDIRPNWPTQQLACLLPNAQYVEVEGAGHHIWLTHATELHQFVQSHIDALRVRA